jgi:glucose/arabinose dehydrogenase
MKWIRTQNKELTMSLSLLPPRLERLVFSDKTGGELRRESLLTELHQRIRDVRQGPDGLLYLLTEEEAAALLWIEPIEPAQ